MHSGIQKNNQEKNKLLSGSTIFRYFKSCFLLLIPILVWNFAFRDLLPEVYSFDVFWKDIPPFLYWGEMISRAALYILAALMPLKIFSKRQTIGLVVYLIGSFIYILSWRPLILYPASDWSTSLIGFIAPAFTPFLIFAGIGLIGHKFFFSRRISPMIYISIAAIFTIFHTWHVILFY